MPPGENVLAVALAAGIAIPYSCRAGRCASCKSRLLAGEIAYPAGTPPGITAAEMARGDVLLCQARPRSDLVVEARRIAAPVSNYVAAMLVSVTPLPLQALRVELRFAADAPACRPGQYLDVRDPAGDAERLAVIEVVGDTVSVESAADDSALRRWLDSGPAPDAVLYLDGPFDRPR